ncbi:conserved Plasmodium protein, unknown function [Plasmodium gonderi]|uniref:Uncharacterized protein n=1 Tax=Plasmodium gonderi TaxID=77519 RepID=A0A1Y1JIA9_PLAGO|nr:conserved Plasmodium protein, unknown function [Plasmodium gonderi]GAW79834.1 conserved Plasmodium protein, unknown function [Plasmodium gonderi]
MKTSHFGILFILVLLVICQASNGMNEDGEKAANGGENANVKNELGAVTIEILPADDNNDDIELTSYLLDELMSASDNNSHL